MVSSSLSQSKQKESFRVVHPNAAGLDVGSEYHFLALPPDRNQSVRRFGCMTPDLEELGAYLKLHQIETLAMEATGIYWVPIVQVLDKHDIKVIIVDPASAKNYKGRKTDVADCQWIQELHTFGLLKECHRPTQDIVTLRAYWRHRRNLVQQASQHTLLIQKALIQMNLHLHKALSDITGTTGMAILRAIVSGERDPKALAALRHNGVKASTETIEKALTGNWLEEHLFALRQSLEAYDLVHVHIAACDEAVQSTLEKMETKPPAHPDAKPPKPQTRRKNQPNFNLNSEIHRITGVNFTAIEGIEANTAFTCLVECGTDLSSFPSEKHFVSWLGLSPNNRITGGKVRSNRTKRNSNRAASAFRLAAQSLHHSDSALGAFFRRIAARRGVQKAITATARKIACMFYRTLVHGWNYVAVGQEQYEAQYQQQRLRRLQAQASAMGLTLVATETGELI